MNYLDIIILCITAILVINGIRKGFVHSLATLLALVLGVWASIHYSSYLSGWLSSTFHPSGTWLTILSYIFTFLLILIFVIILGRLLEKLIKTAGLGIANRLLGGLFGLFKAVLGISVLLFIISTFDPGDHIISRKTRDTSYCYPYMTITFPVYKSLLKSRGQGSVITISHLAPKSEDLI